MTDDEFGLLVESAVARIPEEFRQKIENVSLIIEDYPAQNQIMKLRTRNRGFLLLGLYEGVPMIKRKYYGIGGQLPDKITIFKQPMLSMSRSYEDLKEIVKNTVWHEIAHHFGMDEAQVREAERKRIERMARSKNF
ncbi:MAG: metallopeptidase family protein [Patescibacteria group bacterium]